jgi:hypothetical protein
MSARTLLVFLAASFALAAGALSLGGREPAPQPGNDPVAQVQPGQSAEQVRQILGPPRSISRQILAYRTLEQWTYEQPRPLCLEFDCPRGQHPKLLRVR